MGYVLTRVCEGVESDVRDIEKIGTPAFRYENVQLIQISNRYEK